MAASVTYTGDGFETAIASVALIFSFVVKRVQLIITAALTVKIRADL